MPSRPERPERDGPRVNNEIRARTVRLVGADGEMVGVVGLFEALRLADEEGLDLVEVSPNAEPPVCKILDAGKYKYELQKKENEARKKQKVIDIKEVKLRPTIGDHDYQIKLRQVREFLGEGDKVKFTLRFRGREVAHQDIGFQLMQKVQADIAEIAKVEQHPKLEGKQMIMMVSPK
jgi:translation initiation factor IF-3